MKRALLFCCSILLVFYIHTQNLTNGLLFPQFKEGVVINKDGSRIKAMLNYNSVEEEMLFRNPDNTILSLADPGSVIAVIIDDRRFVPSQKDAFYEEVKAGDDYFYIQWKSNIISKGKGTAYGGHSGTTAISNVGSLQGRGADYGRFNLDEIFETKTERFFYLNQNNKYKKFSSSKTLSKLFKGYNSEIEEFAKTNATDFTKAEDVARIIEYCYSLKSANGK